MQDNGGRGSKLSNSIRELGKTFLRYKSSLKGTWYFQLSSYKHY